jgi:membrane-associated phospholipid phosphatase
VTKHLSAGLGISLAITAAFCALSYVLWDRTLLGATQALPSSWIDLGKRVSVFGKAEWYWVPGLFFTAVFWFMRRNLKFFHAAMFFCLSLAMGGILSTVVKFILGRYRPRMLIHDGLYGFTWLGTKMAETSMPSGHCVTVAAAATALWLTYPPLRPVYALWVAAMMSVRLLAEAHYLSDVVAGTYLGVVAALIALRMMRKWFHPDERDLEMTEPL